MAEQEESPSFTDLTLGKIVASDLGIGDLTVEPGYRLSIWVDDKGRMHINVEETEG